MRPLKPEKAYDPDSETTRRTPTKRRAARGLLPAVRRKCGAVLAPFSKTRNVAWTMRALFAGAACAMLIHALAVNGTLTKTYQATISNSAELARDAGFGIEKITIRGLERLSEDVIREALGLTANNTSLLFDTQSAKHRLEALPWVKRARVMRLLPDALEVTVEEREPFVLWQRAGEIFVADREGRVLTIFDGLTFGDLPLVVGEGAPEAAGDLFLALERHGTVRSELKAAVRVAARRWDLVLKSGVKILLPEEGLPAALNALADVDGSGGLLERGVAQIDLRLPDRVTVRAPEALAPTNDDGGPGPRLTVDGEDA